MSCDFIEFVLLAESGRLGLSLLFFGAVQLLNEFVSAVLGGDYAILNLLYLRAQARLAGFGFLIFLELKKSFLRPFDFTLFDLALPFQFVALFDGGENRLAALKRGLVLRQLIASGVQVLQSSQWWLATFGQRERHSRVPI